MTDPTQDVKEIFGRAIEIESKSEQLAWLDDVCRGKPELRAEVDELLSALNETESFMVRPAVAARISDLHAQPPEAPRLPDHYRPVCEIARGGMGTVWRVVDEKFNRPMAVKTMLPETASDAAAIARFEREMQFTARLQHPAIPPVSDRGVLQGNDIPFFSMKLIEGKTLSKLLAERSDLQDDQSTYIDVFEQVCHAVGYAHSQRVVHRDLKPQNIMVGAFGEVQVMDWGMAKLVDEEVQSNELASPEVEIGPDVHELTTDTKASGESLTVTRAGQVMGTLTYMAPEQARGEIDAAGPKLDVFCLGGILCKILTGAPPFTCKDRMQTFQRIISGDLLDAFNRLDSCEADPELILLCKECLAATPGDRPRDASEVGDRIGRYRKAVREQMENERAERKAAEVRVVEERKRRRIAIALAVATVLLVVGTGTTAWWIQQFTANANAEATQRAELTREDIASALIRSGELRDAFQLKAAESQLDQAEKRLNEARDSGTLAAQISESRDVLQLMEELDEIHYRRSIWKNNGFEAEFSVGEDGAYSRALRNYGIDVFGDESPAALGRRIASHPISSSLISAMDDWAVMDRANGERLFQIVRAADPDPFRDQLRTSKLLGHDRLLELADQALRLDQSPSTIEMLCLRLQVAAARSDDEQLSKTLQTKASDILARSTIAFPESFKLHFNAGNVAMELRGQGKWIGSSYKKQYPDDQALIQAIGYFQSALAIRPNNAASFHNLSLCCQLLGRNDEAELAARFAVKADRNHARAQTQLAEFLIAAGNLSEANEALRIALNEDPDYGLASYVLGGLLVKQDQLDEAESVYRRAIELMPEYAATHIGLGSLLLQARRYDDAEFEFLTALKLNCDSFQRAMTYAALGSLLSETERAAEAEEAFRKSIEAEPDCAVPYFTMGNEIMIEQPLEAESLFRKAIELQPEYPGPYCSLGVILILKLQKVREGVEMFKKGHELGSTQPNWTLTNDERIAWAERHLKFAVMLEEYQRIREPPSESPVIFQLAEFAQFRMLDYRSAYELYQAGLEDTSIPVTLRAKFEYNAALVALSCATASEVEEETNQLQQEERDNLRSKALKWLNDSLAGCELMLQEGTDIPTLIDLLRQWNSAPELTSVSGTFIAQLPETEQSGWKELWSSHKALLELALGN